MANGDKSEKNWTWKTILAIALALLTITGAAVSSALDSRAYADDKTEKVKIEIKTDVQAVEERLQAQRIEDKQDLNNVVTEIKTAQKDINVAISDLKAMMAVLKDRSNRRPR